MTILGIILLVAGAAGFLLLLTGMGGAALLPILAKMPLGLIGWGLLAAVGVVLILLNRRPGD